MLGDQRLLLRGRSPPPRPARRPGRVDRRVRSRRLDLPERYDFAGYGRRARDGPARPVRPGGGRGLLVGDPHPGRPGHAAPAPGGRAARRDRIRPRRRLGCSSGPTRSPGCATTSPGSPSCAARHPVVARLARVHAGLRLPATGRVFQRLLRAVLEQKVTGKEAYRGYAATRAPFPRESGGQPAPGRWPACCCRPTRPPWPPPRTGCSTRSASSSAGPTRSAGPPPSPPGWRRRADAAEATRRLTAIVGIGAWTRPRWSGSRSATRTPSPSATTTSRTWSPGPWPARPAPARARRHRAGQPGRPADAGAAGAVPRSPRPGLRAAGARRPRRAPRFGPRMPIRSFAAF